MSPVVNAVEDWLGVEEKKSPKHFLPSLLSFLSLYLFWLLRIYVPFLLLFYMCGSHSLIQPIFFKPIPSLLESHSHVQVQPQLCLQGFFISRPPTPPPPPAVLSFDLELTVSHQITWLPALWNRSNSFHSFLSFPLPTLWDQFLVPSLLQRERNLSTKSDSILFSIFSFLSSLVPFLQLTNRLKSLPAFESRNKWNHSILFLSPPYYFPFISKYLSVSFSLIIPLKILSLVRRPSKWQI